MKFLIALKSLFKKNISILPYQRNDMVSFVKLKGHSIKINSYAEVEENYNLVFVYYNKVCDILPNGSHKLNEDTIPKLYRFSKTPVGLKALTTRTIVSDAYYINLKEFNNNYFKTIDRVNALADGQKIKIKLDGTFSMKVCDTLKFMKALCNDYAVIRNKKTMKEICSTVGFEISKALNSKNFSVDDYIFNKDKIIATMNELVNNHTNTFGIQVSNFDINNIIVNKKYLNEVQLTALEQLEQSKTKMLENNLPEELDESINNLREDESVVYAGTSSKNVEENNSENIISKTTLAKEVTAGSKSSVEEEKNISKNTITNSEINKMLEESANKILENVSIKKPSYQEPKVVKKQESNINSSYKNISSYSSNATFNKSVTSGGFERPKTHINQPIPQILEEVSANKTLNQNDNLITNKSNIDKQVVTNKPSKDKQVVSNKPSVNKEVVSNVSSNESNQTDNKPKTKLKCRTCGAEILDKDAKFCEKCGKQITNFKVCDCCGAKNLYEAKTCCVCKSVLD